MASLNWSQCPAVQSIPGKVSGAWVLRGTRMPVSAIFENIEAGANTSGWHDRMARRGHGCGRIGVMKRPFSAIVWREGDWFVSQCLDVELASQGRSAEDALANLREAIELHYEPPMATHPPAVWHIEAEVGAASSTVFSGNQTTT